MRLQISLYIESKSLFFWTSLLQVSPLTHPYQLHLTLYTRNTNYMPNFPCFYQLQIKPGFRLSLFKLHTAIHLSTCTEYLIKPANISGSFTKRTKKSIVVWSLSLPNAMVYNERGRIWNRSKGHFFPFS